MNQHQKKIKTNNGHIIVNSDTEHMDEGICKFCGKKVFWVKTRFDKSIPVTKINNGELINHSNNCDWTDYLKKKI